MILIPSYGIGFVVLTAAQDGRALNPLSEAVLAKVVPAMGEVVRQEAEESYVERYKSVAGDVEPNLTLSIDDGPGMRGNGLYSNQSDTLTALKVIQQSSVVVPSGLSNVWRIYPAGWGPTRQDLIRDQNGKEVKVDVEEPRLGFDPMPLVNKQQREQSGLLRVGKGGFRDAVGSSQALDSV